MKKDFNSLLIDKKLPIVTLDNKWHEIFRYVAATPEIKSREEELKELLKQQGKANTQSKDIKKIKSKLMEEVVALSASLNEAGADSKIEKKLAEKKRLIEECNQKLEMHQESMLDLPEQIEKKNRELMLLTIELFYANIQHNNDELHKIDEWINAARIQLKKQVLRKVDRENKNKEMYAYLHDIFGADVLDAFDLGVPPGIETKKEKMTDS